MSDWTRSPRSTDVCARSCMWRQSSPGQVQNNHESRALSMRQGERCPSGLAGESVSVVARIWAVGSSTGRRLGSRAGAPIRARSGRLILGIGLAAGAEQRRLDQLLTCAR